MIILARTRAEIIFIFKDGKFKYKRCNGDLSNRL